ncbi:MAG: helix-turn-helix domain-containing protein [Firmicutes bacterium]|nr:helix-turn-helix domain-containing protein [Bacillota bacterium]
MIKILLVDDEPIVLEVLKQKVPWKMFDMEIIGLAYDGYTALSFIAQNDVDIVFTDVKMPHMDGYILIEKALAIKPDTKFVVLSSYSDFHLVKKSFQAGALDYVLKEDIDSTNMLDALERYKQLVLETPKRKKYLETYFRETAQKNTTLKLNSQYIVLVINHCQNKYEDCIKLNLKNMEQEYSIIWLVFLKGIIVVFDIASFKVSSKENLLFRKIQNIVREQILKETTHNYLVGISDIGTLHTLDSLCTQAIERIESLKFYLDDKFFHESQFSSSEIYEVNTIKFKDDLRYHINNIDFNKVKEVLISFLELLKFHRIDKKVVLEVTLELYLYLINHIFDLGLLPNKFKGDSIHVKQQISNFTSFTQLEKWISNQINEIENYFLSLKGTQPITLIKLYLEQNFGKNLSLREIAQKFGFNESYLSRKFASETGVRIKEYISLLRLEKAKKLLTTTNMKMTEISEKVGYANVEHFSRVFKKYIGVSPILYKNSSKL